MTSGEANRACYLPKRHASPLKCARAPFKISTAIHKRIQSNPRF